MKTTKRPAKRVSIFLDDELIERLKLIAIRQKTTMSQWITENLSAILKRKAA